MTYEVVVLPRAERDAQHVFDWIASRSPDGAVRWWTAFEYAASRLGTNPEGYGLAPESGHHEETLRQFLFRTRRGSTYRGVFVVLENEVRILRIRGPGQPPLAPDELDT